MTTIEPVYVLECRLHDRYTNEWGGWEEIVGYKLKDKFGNTVEEWKESCKAWINIGGHYEYRIIRRVDTIEWGMCFMKPHKTTIHSRHEDL